MKILAKTGNEKIATVYVAQMANGKRIEFVESVQPPIPRDEKWVLIISSLYGCCVECAFCDAGGKYEGKVSKEDMFAQIDFLIKTRYPQGIVPAEKFKVQFARMGEPSLNMSVLDVLREFHQHFNAPGFMPSISTVAPLGTEKFFQELLEIKNELYKGKFQLQFSIHTTDQAHRDQLIPIRKMDFSQIAEYGMEFYQKCDRKITLNFALADSYELNPSILAEYFSPEIFLIKITPVNPTYKANKNKLSSEGLFSHGRHALIKELKQYGYDLIISIGEPEENYIGSNCGQYLENYEQEKENLLNSYTYKINNLSLQFK